MNLQNANNENNYYVLTNNINWLLKSIFNLETAWQNKSIPVYQI